MLKSLSPIDVALIKKIGGNGSSYTLPVATETTLGGVQPISKTNAMTQSVGVDADGALWTEPGSGGGSGGEDNWETLIDVTTEEEVTFAMTELQNPGCFKRMAMYVALKGTSTNTANKGVVLKLNNKTVWSGANNLVIFGYNSFFGTANKTLYGTILFSVGGTISAFSEDINITYANAGASALVGLANTNLTSDTEINSVRFETANNGNVFGVGSIIKVWGCRS